MPVRVLIQSHEPSIGQLVSSLLSQYHYEVHVASTEVETSALARRFGPIDLVLLLDGREEGAEGGSRVREISPEARLVALEPLRVTQPASAGPGDSAGVMLEATEAMDLIECALTAAERSRPAPALTVESLRMALIETTLTFSLLLEQLEFLNGGNGRMIMEYSVKVARELGLSSTHVDEIAFAALLQDIGLVQGRAAGRRRKHAPGEESQAVREHPIRSANLVQRMKLPWRLRHIVLAHHEWYNGLGYPHRRKGREIPLGARILAVVNAFFSMISRRPSRKAMPQGEALEEMRRQAGRQFDPEVVEIFLTLLRSKSFHDAPERRRRIALFSPDHDFAGHVRARLDAAGFDAVILPDGAETVNCLREFHAEALLIDLASEDAQGFQLLHWVRMDAALASLGVLVVSQGQAPSAHAYMAHDMGADDFLEKPLRPSHLVARINAVIRRRDRLEQAGMNQIHDGEGLRGSLAEVSVPELVAMLHEGRKTAAVTLVAAKVTGTLTFEGGSLVHARTGAIEGEQAFLQLYLWRKGDFIIEHGAATAERTVRRRMDLLLSEAEDGLAEANGLKRARRPRSRRPHDASTSPLESTRGDESAADPGQTALLPAFRTCAETDPDSVETRALETAPSR